MSLNRDVLINGILCIILIILLITYTIYVIIDEKKIKYYKATILYDTNWDKYSTMVKKQKRVLFRKKFQLFWLIVLVKIKRLIRWD